MGEDGNRWSAKTMFRNGEEGWVLGAAGDIYSQGGKALRGGTKCSGSQPAEKTGELCPLRMTSVSGENNH